MDYGCIVRVKTSVTRPEERAVLSCLARLERQARDRKDIEIIGRHAARLNREAMDTLGYQQFH